MQWLFNINPCGYVVLYTQCLRYNICSAWFLDIRISTCCSSDQSLLLFKFKSFVLNILQFCESYLINALQNACNAVKFT